MGLNLNLEFLSNGQDLSLIQAIQKAVLEITPELALHWIKHFASNWEKEDL